jgi:hypothetical protein
MKSQTLLRERAPFAVSQGIVSFLGTAYLSVLFAAGFLTNFVPLGKINTGTILLYSLAGILSFIGVLHLVGPLRKHVAIAACLLLGLTALAVAKSMVDSNPASDRIQELIILSLGAWPFLFFLQINSPTIQRTFLKTIAIGLFGLSVFSIFQGIFASSLPLSLFVLRGDEAFGAGDDQFRPTGLTGNPIIFSSILVFASACFAALWLEKRRYRFLMALIASLAANYLTYTRASLVLVIPVLIFVWLFHNRFRIKHKILTLAIVVLAIAGALFILVKSQDSIVVQRLMVSNPESAASTLEHFRQIQAAEDAISTHPLAGAGMGSQGDFVGTGNSIITDGAWWILALEFGLPLSVVAALSLFIVLIPIAKHVLRWDTKNRALAIATLSFHAFMIPANFINSALLGHISFGLYWAALGLSFAGIDRNLRLTSRHIPVDPRAENLIC